VPIRYIEKYRYPNFRYDTIPIYRYRRYGTIFFDISTQAYYTSGMKIGRRVSAVAEWKKENKKVATSPSWKNETPQALQLISACVMTSERQLLVINPVSSGQGVFGSADPENRPLPLKACNSYIQHSVELPRLLVENFRKFSQVETFWKLSLQCSRIVTE
jgi:hypothetical protein